MSEQMSLEEILSMMNDTAMKSHAMIELISQVIGAIVVSTGNKEAIEELIKSSSSSEQLTEAHQHAQQALLTILNSVHVIPLKKH